MTREGQLFRLRIGEILANILRERWPHHTAKKAEAKYELDATTAKNVVKGHVSERSITSILWGEGDDVYELLDAIGLALTGQTRHEWEEQKLTRIIEEAENARGQIRRLRAKAEAVRQRAHYASEARAWDAPAALERRAT